MFGEAAAKLGIELILATDRCHILEDPWGDRAVPIRFEEPEEAASKIPDCDGILAVGDRPAIVAALAAERLGIRFHPSRAAIACQDKSLSREAFRAAGLPAPHALHFSFDDGVEAVLARAQYPCVLKPTGLTASRGVIRTDNAPELRSAFARIRAMVDPREHALVVESFIEGREFALEGLVTRGALQVLALFDKPDPLDGPFFEETIYATPSRESEATQAAIIATVERAIGALGLCDGPIHAEMRVNHEEVFMLEVAARPIGGLCAKSLRFAEHISLEELLLRHVLGADVSQIARETSASGVMMIPIPGAGIYQDVYGIEEAQGVEGIEEVIITAKPGQKIVPLPEGASYLGFLFARAEHPVLVEEALRKAHDRLKFDIAQTLPLFAGHGP